MKCDDDSPAFLLGGALPVNFTQKVLQALCNYIYADKVTATATKALG